MATTDSRTGFRLPWSTDRAASREASADPAEESAEALAPVDEASATPAPESGEAATIQDAAGDAVRGHEEEPVTTMAPDATHVAEPASPAARPAATPARHRPTKFLADLTRAMQAAAEQARVATLDQFRAEGTSVIEQIHARSSTGATDLRRRADDDVAAIKEWSKAEIARIREETERRVTSRREQLEGQLERHAALIEHEIEKVRGRIAAFEIEMGGFFDDLVGEEDPAVFAARAANLPEAPSFDDLEEDALSALLGEPGLGMPERTNVEATAPATEAAAPAVEAAIEVPAVEAAPEAPAAEATVDAPAGADEAAVLEREAALAAIEAAAEAAESLPPDADAGVAEAAADAAEAPVAEDATAEAAEPDVEPATGPAAATEPELDPRLAMLGLTPDFAAAEAAAAEAAATDVDDLPEIGGEALAARLSGLVPAESAPAADAATVTTQVVTTGLVSVASIASFKRHLGRLAGVSHVGVSSGPDGEFVFAVAHEPETSLRELIPTLPGFAARVVGSGEGIVQVSAQDPQD